MVNETIFIVTDPVTLSKFNKFASGWLLAIESATSACCLIDWGCLFLRMAMFGVLSKLTMYEHIWNENYLLIRINSYCLNNSYKIAVNVREI